MRRLPALFVTASLAFSIACEKEPEPTETPEPVAVEPEVDAEAEAKAKAEKEAEEKRVAEEKAAKEAQAKRIKEATERMEAEYAKEAERWDAKLKKSAKKLTAKKYKSTKQALVAAQKSKHREPNNAARDKYRHPVKTMEFFGLKQDMTVVEVSPGSGWYTELVAVVLHEKGKLVIPSYDSKSEDPLVAYFGRGDELMLGKNEDIFGKVERHVRTTQDDPTMGEAGSADMVLVFRMMHNWVRGKTWDKNIAAAHAVLKPGGVLAVIQHRAAEGAKAEESANKGYLPQAWVIEKIEAAGFKLEAKSEINANAKDTKDYPDGVWTLPPRLRNGDKDKEKYMAIGESDRMTLKFVKQ